MTLPAAPQRSSYASPGASPGPRGLEGRAPVQRYKKEVPDDVAAVGDPGTVCTVVRLSLARVRLRRAALRFAGWLRVHRLRDFFFDRVVDTPSALRGRARHVSASMSMV